MNRFLLILAAAAAFCFADDVAAPATQDALSATGNEAAAPMAATEPDSIAIYRELIKQEEAGANFGANFVGMTISSALMGAGIALSSSRNFTVGYENSSHLRLASTGAFLFAVPAFVFNLVAYHSHKTHANRRDEHRDALERLLARDADAAADGQDGFEDEVDLVELYGNLIRREAEQAHYGANFVGIAVSGALVGAGFGFLLAMPYAHNHDSFLDVGPVIAFLFGMASFSAGVPLLAYNIHAYRFHKAHADRRDAYREELERRLGRRPAEKRNAAQVLFFPTVDAANSGAGLNLAILF